MWWREWETLTLSRIKGDKIMEIKDSGERREFSTGAVRDIAEGKGRCDLLPLGVIYLLTENSIFRMIDSYIKTGNLTYLCSVIDKFTKDHYFGDISTAMLAVARHYEDGAKKYAERNWEIGIPLHCYIDSGVRHYLKFLRGDTDEPHDRAFVWNMMCCLWTIDHKPELIDLPA